MDGVRFGADLQADLTRTTAFEAVMRVRATKGINVSSFYGNFYIRGADLLALPNATPETAFNVELSYDPAEVLAAGSVISVQAALLYTSSSGERRIAVHTLARPVVTVLADLFRNVDGDAVANMMAKIALDNALKNGLPSARKYLHSKVVDIIRAYRNTVSGGMGMHGGMVAPGRMGVGGGAPGGPPGGGGGATDISTMLPECLQLLPLLSLGLAKSPAYRGGEQVRSDERSALVYRMLTMPVTQSKKFVYPQLYGLHDLEPEDGEPLRGGEDFDPPSPYAGPRVRLPNTKTLSVSNLSSVGAF